ncbi:hypothetical protein [Filimonas effusa]|uniref:Outer membrane protein beta-barrel domain-containing protein n=1 Tax=Filimonas effusa TaxID=2508721 RepID=A0A4Q1DAJ1_9BACT|nr:hypothetical protein [Filimonas effusa]RXK86422.1 hypothetical protein ESB13_06345 [Filimonas effusa]
MSDNSLERQIQKMMEGLEFKPDPVVWKNVKAGLAPEKKKPVIGWRIPLLLLLLLAGTGAGIWSLYHNNAPSPLTAQNENAVIANKDNTDSFTTNQSASGLNGHNSRAESNAPANNSSGNTHSVNSAKPESTAAAGGQLFNDNKPVNVSPDTYAGANNNGISAAKKNTDNRSVNGVLSAKNTAGTTTPGATGPEKLAAINARKPQQSLNSSNKHLNGTAGNGYQMEPDNLERLPAQYPVDPEIEHVPQTAFMTRMPLLKQQNATPVVSAPVITIKDQPASQWHFLPFVSGGIAKVIGENDGGISTYQKNNDQIGYNASPGSQQAVRSVVYYKTAFNTGKAFNAGVLAERSLLGKLSVQLGLRYQYVHYSTLISTTTESIGGLTNGFYSTVSTSDIHGTENYKMHYLGVPVLLHYDLTRPVGITAGVVNDFMVGANKDGNSLGGTMNVWMPNAYFAFVVKIPGQSRLQWQLMPYIQYGLKTMAKQGDQHLLQTGLQVTLKLK